MRFCGPQFAQLPTLGYPRALYTTVFLCLPVGTEHLAGPLQRVSFEVMSKPLLFPKHPWSATLVRKSTIHRAQLGRNKQHSPSNDRHTRLPPPCLNPTNNLRLIGPLDQRILLFVFHAARRVAPFRFRSTFAGRPLFGFPPRVNIRRFSMG